MPPSPPDRVARQRITVQATPLGVRNALNRITELLKHEQIGMDVAGTTEIVLAEVMNNIVEHAYAGREDGLISLGFCRVAGSIDWEISDTGTGMPDARAPAGRAPDLNQELDDLPEGGFGWMLIRDLTEELKYERHGSENRLNFRIAIPAETSLNEISA